jgi:hypothetical protein
LGRHEQYTHDQIFCEGFSLTPHKRSTPILAGIDSDDILAPFVASDALNKAEAATSFAELAADYRGS